MKARTLLSELGIHATLKGFRYLQYALELCMENEDYLLWVYKWLCTDVAAHFHTTQNNVEHCMRTAIANCWLKGNRQLLIELAGYELKKTPSNGEFIDILYHHLKFSEKAEMKKVFPKI
ncbi:MAG: hypothetical protein HFH59_13985 [Lachnospiraceae bacterium]|jgi:two-component system response regulator (stage 0 sporulation protein A)|nr:hypothetical protein [Lachnospiraceae bacterium]MCI9100318.1 hypothetical protein [Lachnospiraceae bacterium]MCI9358610.1 hypothetical protein [Lachnospiraceae bacterium]